ncbi:hypothetical protein BZL35_00115 [Candidatus Pandoraea novymonadis]|uniref:Uncharacterized protein n=1 Tax=Candidatus Pandoraea novymonadis TaxID=1808959 RepID=A0ABX5FFF7_9BURK|nr:hypothetical protein BZL35_00115 [Candidatus Pandoraea novymonadis]
MLRFVEGDGSGILNYYLLTSYEVHLNSKHSEAEDSFRKGDFIFT